MTDLPRKTGTLSVGQQANIDDISRKPGSPPFDPNARSSEPDNSTFGKQEPAEAMVPVKVLRGYWPKGEPGDIEMDPQRHKLKVNTLCTLPEAEAQTAADNGIVRILTAKGYRDAQEAAAIAPPPPLPRTTIIQKTA